MRQYLFLLLFNLLLGLIASGQQIMIIDAHGNPISNVHVFNNQFNALSDDNGNVIFEIKQEGQVYFQHISYQTLVINNQEIRQHNYVIYLQEAPHTACEIELVGRTCKERSEFFQELETIGTKELRSAQGQSTPDILQSHSGIFVQKSQMGGGSPIVRGFEANKVLLVIDGVRLNNAIYRNGHLHNILSIDEQLLERIDLIYGPGSLNYGSDAIGGVLHFVTKQPKTNQQFLNYFTSYATANNGFKSYIDFNLSNSKIASITSLSYGAYGDMKMGKRRDDRYPDFGKRLAYISTDNNEDKVIQNKDVNLQVGTAYNQWNLSNKTRYLINDKLTIGSNLQYSSSSNVPRYDRLSSYKNGQLKYAEWNYGPQDRFLFATNLDYYGDKTLFDQAKVILSYQNISEKRIKRKYQSNKRITNIEKVKVLGATVDMIKHISSNQKLTYGIDGQYNDIKSDVTVTNIKDQSTSKQALTRYPNGYNHLYSVGVYTNYFIDNIIKNVSTNFGFRYQLVNTKMTFKKTPLINWDETYYDGISNHNTALTWSGAIKWQPIRSISLSWMSASAFRAPNIDDLAKIRVKGDEISFVNLDLTPERSISHELGIKLRPISNNRSTWNLFLFHTDLKDAIIRQSYEVDGSDLFIQDGDSLHIIVNANAAKAKVNGISSAIKLILTKELQFDASITKILGVSEFENEISPLAHIPPTYAKVALKYTGDKWSSKLSYLFYDDKPVSEYGDSSDNLHYATQDGTPAYHLWNIQSSYQIDKKLTLSLAVQNIMDIHYRLFSSGVSSAGRNFVVSVRGTI